MGPVLTAHDRASKDIAATVRARGWQSAAVYWLAFLQATAQNGSILSLSSRHYRDAVQSAFGR